MKKLLAILIIVALALPGWIVTQPARADDSTPWPTEAWNVSTPEAQGMDSDTLADFMLAVAEPSYYLDSLLIVRHGNIVAETYFPTNAPHLKHHLYSASKSITSILIGIAIDQGYIDGVDVPMLDFFPDRMVEGDDWTADVTLEHLLTMSSGMDCDYIMGHGRADEMMGTDDWVQFALELPHDVEPGSTFRYCNVSTFILSAIINQTTGMSALEFGQEYLFGPLGITDVAWSASPDNVSFGASELQLTPRDMAKIGYLYLHGGEWDGEQIVSQDWVTTSMTAQMPYIEGFSYGYQWWVADAVGAGMAIGFGGQYIWVLPSQDVVMVATGGATDPTRVAYQLMPIFGGLLSLPYSTVALPEDGEGFARLESTIDALENPAPMPMVALPDTAVSVNGTMYGLWSRDLITQGQRMNFKAPEGMGLDAWDTQALGMTFEGEEAALTLVFVDGESLTIPVGLDGVFRLSEGRLGKVGAYGFWITDNTFRLHLKMRGDCAQLRMDIQFNGPQLEIVSYEISRGLATVVLGMALPPAE